MPMALQGTQAFKARKAVQNCKAPDMVASLSYNLSGEADMLNNGSSRNETFHGRLEAETPYKTSMSWENRSPHISVAIIKHNGAGN